MINLDNLSCKTCTHNNVCRYKEIYLDICDCIHKNMLVLYDEESRECIEIQCRYYRFRPGKFFEPYNTAVNND